ncbi:TetR/AcrR family transcriptional regulator [Martelella alba]|uniref:TetR/AcrR family transcriptional regulator n=1 Tax=Martelella alba TaxID=2590451 RepID=A0ABY2SN55_9HYPH|nr:TetR/AcrR family transcriptional regulator [Martelella alba]TKI05093.1 TetR/AcrR family transcriptional regulator [Martelella alba]
METDRVASVRKGRGRPKQFDRDDALDKALQLFWRHGYEATSLSDLVAATGAKAPTLYGEFGNKEGLFRAAVERYISQFAERGRSLLSDPNSTAQGAIENFLRDTAALYTDKSLPSGCFLVCTSAALSAASSAVGEMLRNRHRLHEKMLMDFLRDRQLRGEIPDKTDVADLAKYFACLTQGMSVQARDGASQEDLNAIVAKVMSAWPQLLMAEPGKARLAVEV